MSPKDDDGDGKYPQKAKNNKKEDLQTEYSAVVVVWQM